MKIAGAVLICLSFCAIGFIRAKNAEERASQLDAFYRFLKFISERITDNFAEKAYLYRNYRDETLLRIGFLAALSSFASEKDCVKKSLSVCEKELTLTKSEMESISILDTLGAGIDVQTTAHETDGVLEQFRQKSDRLKVRIGKKQPVFWLWATMGLTVALILW